LAKVRMYAYAPLPMYFSRQHGLSMSNNAIITHPITCVLLSVNRAYFCEHAAVLITQKCVSTRAPLPLLSWCWTRRHWGEHKSMC